MRVALGSCLTGLSALLAGAALSGFALSGVSLAATASRSVTSPLALGEGDAIYKYDFNSENAAQNNADWPMSLIVYNGTSVNDLKAVMDQFNYKQGSTGSKYAYLSDGASSRNVFEWDSDNGRKMLSCPSFGEQSPHYRVYADRDDYLDNMTRGPYVMVSTHRDYQECGGGSRFYDSEVVEGGITSNLATLYGGYQDRFDWGNAEPYRAEGNHIWDSNGYGSYINRCPGCN